MKLGDFVNGIPGFSKWTHADRIKFFAWFLHSKRGRERFSPADIKACYADLGMDEPSAIQPFLAAMEKRRPREVLHDRRGYALEKAIKDQFEAKYGQRDITIQVTQLLSELPTKVPNVVERDFLNEALICYRHGAFRAAIVMCWNLAYDHLCDYVLANHLPAFNARWPTRFEGHYKKAGVSAITTRDDFAEFKEDQMIELCKAASIISDDTFRILKEKLGRRNTAAHPNSIKITQLQAEDFISDLVNNVVLALK